MAKPAWTYQHCHNHVHVSIMVRLRDGGACYIVSPGLNNDRELIDIYLDFISEWTDVRITIDDYIPRSEFPTTMTPTEESLELEDDEE